MNSLSFSFHDAAAQQALEADSSHIPNSDGSKSGRAFSLGRYSMTLEILDERQAQDTRQRSAVSERLRTNSSRQKFTPDASVFFATRSHAPDLDTDLTTA